MHDPVRAAHAAAVLAADPQLRALVND